jgi:diguanylate cyclase (GGDEF)-like protein
VTRERAELICDYVRQFYVQCEGKTLEAVTLSLGVAIFPKDDSTSAAILKAADHALYRAKHEGRSRVVVANLKISSQILHQ